MDALTALEFFKLCTLFNFIILAISSLMLLVFKKNLLKIHSHFSGIDETKLKELYFTYMSIYKVLFIVFNLVPFLALSVMN